MWEEPTGERRWEAIEEGQYVGFLEQILSRGVHPATVMIAYAPILFHWVWKEYHGGLSDVYFQKINEEIYGKEPVGESRHTPVNVPLTKKSETKFGWIAPDGRFFGCDYGGHSSLASKIVGEIQYVRDPERRLEDLGWLKIFSGSGKGRRYSVGMGHGKSITDEQIKALERMGLSDAHGVSEYLRKRGERQ